MSDKDRYEYILKHYHELKSEAKLYFVELLAPSQAMVLKKAIYMDLFQIGEHINKMSESTKSRLDKNDVRGVIDTRNIIGHGYKDVDPEIIQDTIEESCPKLISRLQELFE